MILKGKVMKRVVCMLSALCLVMLESSSVHATELPVTISLDQLNNISQYDTNGDGLVYATIENNNLSANLSALMPNADVTANGVRLRNRPSSTATVLELMYNGESVCVNYGVSDGGSGWYYLQRSKTGTWGWASTSYISPWY